MCQITLVIAFASKYASNSIFTVNASKVSYRFHNYICTYSTYIGTNHTVITTYVINHGWILHRTNHVKLYYQLTRTSTTITPNVDADSWEDSAEDVVRVLLRMH